MALGGVNLSYEQLITIAVAVAAAVFLRLFFKRTRTGVAMRAVVDDPSLASLAGAPSGRIASYAWMIGVMFAGVAGILIAPSSNMSILPLIELVIFGYAAAVVGRLRSIPLTFLGAMILGIGNSLVVGYGPASDVSDIQARCPWSCSSSSSCSSPRSGSPSDGWSGSAPHAVVRPGPPWSAAAAWSWPSCSAPMSHR